MLKLQKIELLGFKSFADRTEIAFNGTGVAAVVGPNGCGKSNISDAIHWVLGEQSARTLRSGRMQDVIFSGTPGRKATGLAEVRLTLLDPEAKAFLESVDEAMPHIVADESAAGENGTNGTSHSVHLSAAAAAKEAGAITVCRRLFASGESEYLLNERPCRLRDIQELFLGTGLGPDSYAIIEQGRIGQILSAKPYERRALIEEAAGITKFKAKRKLAWAKLEASKQNLARVNDILEEVTRQVNSLQRQAARARRYRELNDQLRASLRDILASRYQQKEEEAAQAALEVGAFRRAAQEQLTFLEESERGQQAAYRLAEEREAELRQASEERSTLRLAAERARGQIASQSQQALYLVRRKDEAQVEERQLRVREGELQSEQSECAAGLAQVQAERETLQTELTRSEVRRSEHEATLKESQPRLEQLRAEMLEAVGECATLRNQVLQLEQYVALAAKQLHQTESQMGDLVTAQNTAVSLQKDAEKKLADLATKRSSISTRRHELETALSAGREEELRQRTQLEQHRSELAGLHARKKSLEEVLSDHAYSTEAVQRLFDLRNGDVRNGDLQNGAGRADGISPEGGRRFEPVGVLADFLDVDPNYERVVEEFLREELDFVVVKDWASAQEGLQLLRNGVQGRATFLMEERANGVSQVLKANGNGRSLQGVAGVVKPLESCVRFTNGFSQTAGALLPKIERGYLVEDPDIGRSLAEQHPDLYFLTPQGTCFQGAFVSAGQGEHQGPLALKRELRSVTRAVEEQEGATAHLAEVLSQTTRRIETQQAEQKILVEEEQESEKRLVMMERDLTEARADQQRIADRLSYLSLEVERMSREAERARAQWAHDTTAIAEREQRRSELEEETKQIDYSITALQAAREEARAVESDLRGRLAALEERQRATAATLARIEHTLAELSRRQQELLQHCEQWERERVGLEGENARLQNEIAAAEQRSDALTQRVTELEASGEQHRERLAELEQELQRLRQDLELVREKRTATEVQLAKLQSDLDHIQESCRNDLQMEMEALLADVAPRLAGEELAAAEESCRQVRTKLENLGPINMMALEEFEEARQRHEFLEKQQQDLTASIADTAQAIAEIDTVCNQQFNVAFEQIGEHFQRTFAQLFGGGQGMLRLLEAEDSFEAGIEIIAQPPGKKLQSVLLLSGGEKALAAMALLLAIFRYKPSPFCILDEVDAPLDEANVGRFAQMVTEMSTETQFILITHSKRTMSVAPVLYGVTMQEPGVSKIVSVRFNGVDASPGSKSRAESREPAMAEAVA